VASLPARGHLRKRGWPSFFSALLALSLFSAGCATLPYAKVESALVGGDLPAARAALAKGEKDYGQPARLLYLFDRTSLAHYDGDWTGSNEALEEADRLIDELYTKSLSAEAKSFLINDMSLPYTSENFERVMLHVLGMLNYASLGQRDSALVEARRADERLKQYAATVGEDKVGYREDALARYVSAVLYEGGTKQDLWDAYLDYKKADEAFDLYAKLYATPKPARLKADLQRFAEGLGEKEDLEKWRQRDGAQAYVPLAQTRRDQAEVVALLYDGLAPVKVSKSMHLPVNLEDGTAQYFSLALPDFVVRGGAVPEAELVVSGKGKAKFELFQDINSIAVRDLQDRSALIMVKATARALAKFQAARAVQNKAREAGGGAEILAFLGTNIYNIVSEQADIRSWRTLPGRIWVARLAVPPGPQTGHILVQRGGQSLDLDLGTLDLKAGEKRFVLKALY
jgi:hypothetical protein